MKRAEDIFFVGYPKNKIGILDYFCLFVCCLWIKVTSKRQLVLNLPCEVQYPYIYSNWGNGYMFIKFAEGLGKLICLKLYWTNCLPCTTKDNTISYLSVSWDFIPKNINLLINSKIIKRGKNKIKKLLSLHGQQVRFV